MAATKKLLGLDKIVVEKGFNARMFFDDDSMQELKTSILNRGLRYPISVKSVKITEENFQNFEIWQNGEKVTLDESAIGQEKFVIIGGERRYRCHVMIKEEGNPIKGINVTIEKGITKKDDDLILSYIENTGQPFTPIEEATLFNRLIEVFNWTPEEVADATGKKIKVIKSRIMLLKGSKEVQEAIASKQIPISSGLEIIRKSEGDIEVQNEMIEEIKIQGKDIIGEERRKKKEERKKERLRKEIEAETAADDDDDDDVTLHMDIPYEDPIKEDEDIKEEGAEINPEDVVEVSSEVKEVKESEMVVNVKTLKANLKSLVSEIEEVKTSTEGVTYGIVAAYAKATLICDMIQEDIMDYLEEEFIEELEDVINA